MILRPLQETDRTRLLALWNQNVRFDLLSPTLLDEKVWGDDDYAAELAFIAEEGEQLIGFAMGVVRPGLDAPRGYLKMMVVAAPQRRKGVGGQLLAEVEAALGRRGVHTVRLCESAPNYLTPGLDVRYTKGMLFFQKHGYERFGETYNLAVDLQASDFATEAHERALSENGLAVRRAEEEDRAELMGFLRQEGWAAWQAEVRRTLMNDPVSLHLALEQGTVIGFSAHDSNNVGTGWFGPMGTAVAARGLGIGGVLLRRCLRDLKAQGLATATIAWVGPIAFYAHYAEANIARVFYRYQKTLV